MPLPSAFLSGMIGDFSRLSSYHDDRNEDYDHHMMIILLRMLLIYDDYHGMIVKTMNMI